ncbi:MAG: sigma-70 domain-containing protein [Polyangiaceae bacterium]
MDTSLVSAILARLLAPGHPHQPAALSLDAVADAIGAAPVTMQDIEAIFDGLEAAGQTVEAEPRDPPAALRQVLSTVRSFSAVSGRRPTVVEIAQHSGLSVAEVRFAMLYARVLVR